MNVLNQKLVKINVPEVLSGNSFTGDTGIVLKECDNNIMVEVLVTSGKYIGRTFSFIKTHLVPV